MAITTLDGLIAAAKQTTGINKTASRTAIASSWFSVFDLAGSPGAGVLAGTSTANGVVPTDATAGCMPINTFGGGATGYLSRVEFGSTVACRQRLFDMLFKAGAYAFNANTALSAQPSFSGRVPGGTDFNAIEIWIEAVTAFTGNPTFTITYTNQAGTAGRIATLAAGLAPTLGRKLQIPLQAGDSGVQLITNVQCTVATVGTFNVLVQRKLWSGRVRSANDGDVHGWDKTGGAQVWDTSAVVLDVAPDSTATGIPEVNFDIVNA